MKSLMQDMYFFFSLFFVFSLFAADCNVQFRSCVNKQCVVTDLTDSYKTAQTLLSCLQKEIANLPQKNQSDLLNELAAAQAAVQKAYTANKALVDSYQNGSSSPTVKARMINIYVLNGKQAIEGTVQKMQQTLSAVEAAIGYNKQSDEAKKERVKQAQAAAAYYASMMKLFRALKPAIASFNAEAQKNYSILIDISKKTQVDASLMKRIEDVTTEWQNLIGQFNTIYQQNKQPVVSDDATNYVVLSIRSLIYFYCNLIESQLNKIDHIKIQDAYPLLTNVAQQIVGTGNGSTIEGLGYTGIVTQIITNYFKENQASLQKIYAQGIANLTYSRYKSLLLSLSGSKTISEEMLSHANQWYALLMSVIKSFAPNKQTAEIKDVATGLALLYVISAQQQLKSMSIDKDTTPFQQKAIDYYTKAADCYKQAGDSVNQASSATMAANLTQAQSLVTQAKSAVKKNDLSSATTLYAQAQAAFQSAGDAVDAAATGIMLADVQTQYILAQAQDIRTSLKKNGDDFAKAIIYCSSPAILPDQQDSFVTALTSINDAYKSLFQLYVSGITIYQTVAELDSSKTPSQELVQKISGLNSAAAILEKIIQGNTLLFQANDMLKAVSFSAAQELFRSALILYQAADQQYAKDAHAADFVPLYPQTLTTNKNESWTFALAVQRFIAKKSLELAASKNDPIAAFQWYAYAQLRNYDLTSEMQQFLDQQIKKMVADQELLKELVQAAQTAQQQASALGTDAWKATINLGYTSAADTAWENVLRYYSALYKNGDQSVRDIYLKAIDDYATAYASQVPDQFYPQLGTALIRYHAYVLSALENNEQEMQGELKKIEDLALPFFATVQSLITAVDASNLIQSSSSNQMKVVAWQDRFEQALLQQDDVLHELASAVLTSEQTKELQIFEKKVDEQGTIQDAFVPTGKVVTLQNPALKLADITKQLGDYYYQKNDYITAYVSYNDALNQYKNGNRFDKVTAMQHQFDVAKTLYFGTLYQQSVMPQGSVSFGSFTVPLSYDLKYFKQTVPRSISDQFPDPSQLQKYTPEQVAQFTTDVMIDLYLYWWIKTAFGQSQFTVLHPVMKASLKKNKEQISAALQSLVNEDQLDDAVNIVLNAQIFQKILIDRVAQKKTSFALQQERTSDGTRAYSLAEIQIPIPPFQIMTVDTQQLYYKGYPYAYNYYSWASQLFAPPKPQQDRIVVNGVSFIPGNRPDLYQQMHDDILNTYFSQAVGYQTDVKAVKNTAQYKKLVAVNKNDMKASIADYLDQYNAIKNDYNAMILHTDNALNESFIDRSSGTGKKINDLVGALYQKLGDELSVFLIGDPRSRYYHATVLSDIAHAFINGIVNYGVDPNLYQKYAQWCERGGDILIQQGMYYVSSRLYVLAEKGYRSITPQTAQITALADAVALKRLQNVCKAATLNIADYLDARVHGIMVKADDGTMQKVPLDQVIEQYNATLSQSGGAEDVKGLDGDAKKRVDDLKAGLLDALIFYSGSSQGSTAPYVAGFGLLASAALPNADAATMATVTKNAQQMLTDYMQKNSFMLQNAISLDAVTTLTLSLPKMNIAQVVQQGFDTLVKNITSNTSGQQKAVVYEALSTWCSLLYTNFASLYINDFLGGIPSDPQDLVSAVNNLKVSIDTESNAMNSAVWQFFGDQDDT